MCCLIVCPSSNRPSLRALRQIAVVNPHGLGLAWSANGAVHWTKSDDVDEIHRLARRLPDTVVIHARWASVGGVHPQLRHPFPVTEECSLSSKGSAPAVLFQNGTWSSWEREVDAAAAEGFTVPSGIMSDARAAAWLVHVRGSREWLGKNGSRWVYWAAGADPELFGHFHEFRGCLYSNMYWRKGGSGTARKPRPGPAPRPTSGCGSQSKPVRVADARIREAQPASRELPDRMPSVPWFQLSDEFRATAARVRARQGA